MRISLRNIRKNFFSLFGIASLLSVFTFVAPVYALFSADPPQPTIADFLILSLIYALFLFPVVIFFHGAVIFFKHFRDKHLRGRGTHKMSLGFPSVILIATIILISFAGHPIGGIGYSQLLAFILLIRGLFLWIKYRKTDIVLKKRGRTKVLCALYTLALAMFAYYFFDMMSRA